MKEYSFYSKGFYLTSMFYILVDDGGSMEDMQMQLLGYRINPNEIEQKHTVDVWLDVTLGEDGRVNSIRPPYGHDWPSDLVSDINTINKLLGEG